MSEYASIEYSKDLAELFPDAIHWWNVRNEGEPYVSPFKVNSHDTIESYPAITIQMALDKLDKVTIKKNGPIYDCWDERRPKQSQQNDRSLPNALCKMIQYLNKEGYERHDQSLDEASV